MEHVFISYVRENTEIVDRLARYLCSFGVNVWLDREQIAPGRRWKDAIREAIQHGAFFIACFSAEYMGRSKTYMNEELILAIEELRQRFTEQSWFIPVLLNPCTVPNRTIGGGETLRSIQHVALYEDWNEGLRRIISVIKPQDSLGKELRLSREKSHVNSVVSQDDLFVLDFGTSFSCVAILNDNGEPLLIPDSNGRAFVPSVVTFESNLDYWVGWEALNLATRYPERTIFNIKRLLGLTRELEIGAAKYTPELVASLIIGALKKNTEEYLGRPIKRALVSVPGNFSIPQANALARACELAGIQIQRLIGEPNAAGLLLHGYIPFDYMKESYVLVLDLGGGTFDVSVLLVGDGIFEVRAIIGSNSLGGADYDGLLYKYALTRIDTHIGRITDILSTVDHMKLRMETARAKIALSSGPKATIILSGVEISGFGLQDLEIEIGREDFRQVTADLNDRVETYICKVLEISEVNPSELDIVLLAGQGLKIFTISEIIDRLIPNTPKITRFQEGAVIHGLCQYSGVLKGIFSDFLLLDCNYTLVGIKCLKVASLDENYDFIVSPRYGDNIETFIILPTNETIPRLRTFTGYASESGDLELTVVEGDTLESNLDVVIAKIILSGLQKGDKFEVQIDCDANRTLVFWAANPRTMEIRGFQINNSFKEPLLFPPDSNRIFGMNTDGYDIYPIRKNTTV